MIHMLLGLLSFFAVFKVFSFFNPQTKLKQRHLAFVFVLCILSAYVVHSYEHIWLWIGFLCLVYCCLDDFHQTSISLILPVWISLCFYFINKNPYSILWTIGFFALFFLFDWIWTKYISENFDILFLFPLLYIPFFLKGEWMAYGIFLLIIIIALFSKNSWIGEGDAYFVLPLLYVIDPSDYFSFFITSLFIALPFSYYQIEFTEEEEFAFTPFLFGGFLLIYGDFSLLLTITVVGSIISSLILWFLSKKRKKVETL